MRLSFDSHLNIQSESLLNVLEKMLFNLKVLLAVHRFFLKASNFKTSEELRGSLSMEASKIFHNFDDIRSIKPKIGDLKAEKKV